MRKQVPKLTLERQKLAEDNIKHAYWLAHKWAKKHKTIDTDEFISMALFGLTKAAATYDSSKATQFNTYSRFVIENEFKNEIKKVKKYLVGIYETDKTQAPESDLESGMDLMTAIAKMPCLYQEVLLEFYQEGLNQYEIAEKHEISQTKVSVILKKAKEMIAAYMKP